MNEVRSQVYCTNCQREFVAVLDLALDGNHEITCPLCGHVHYRVVRAGEVTEDRYRSSAGPTYIATTSNVTISSTWTTNTMMASSWLNLTTLTTT